LAGIAALLQRPRQQAFAGFRIERLDTQLHAGAHGALARTDAAAAPR